MWRISDDFWDDWKLLRKQFDYTRDWAPYVGLDGTWPDADMLPLGTLRLADRDEKLPEMLGSTRTSKER